MANGMYVAASGTVSRLAEIEVLSQNLAHIRSPGFKRSSVAFHDVLDQERGNRPVDGDKDFVQADDPIARLEEGPLVKTDNPLDLAVSGPAFLRVQTSEGERLTRNGRMILGQDGALRTQAGLPVLGSDGARIHLPTDLIPEIDADGTIRTGETYLGQIGLARVDLAKSLDRDSAGLFIPPTEASQDMGPVSVMQGFIEESNTPAIAMMTELITVQRHYEALHQVITTYREMDQTASGLAR
ncbi:MAG: flagellar hook-basal body protein [Myxococcota bacterium]